MNIQNRTQSPAALPRNARCPRRGILLLVVLSLLTLFLMIGMAFIVTANQYRKMNKTRAHDTQESQAPVRQQKLLDEVINQLVRDTNNQNSSLRFHSLLRDLYGNDGVEIGPSSSTLVSFVDRTAFTYTDDFGNTIDSSVLDTRMGNIGDQFFWIAVHFDLPVITTPPLQPPLREVDNYYNGSLLTFANGTLRGTTTRIVGYDFQITVAPTTTNVGNAIAVFTLLPLDANELIISLNLTTNNSVGPQGLAIINGRPFNGTGTGYNPFASTGAKLNTTELISGTNRELALLPNSVFFDFNSVNTNGPGTYSAYYSSQWASLTTTQQQQLIAKMGLVGLGGSDESYDAPDYQNMALAMLPVGPVEFVAPGSPSLGNMILPSFHRPALINYWSKQIALETEPNMLRKVLLRPSWFDHPKFTGSNPDLASNIATFKNALETGGDTATPSNLLLDSMIYGPWDVDNDNDGIRDSVWVDFGAPIMKNADGKLVKAMAAVLLLDMDGRLNLNAHGSEDIANPASFGLPIAGVSNTTDILPQGQGYGPAEISLGPLMPGINQTQRWRWYKRMLQGAEVGASIDALDPSNDDTDPPPPSSIGAQRFRRRTAGKFGQRPIPGNRTSQPLPGIDNTSVFDILAQLKMQGVPQWADGSILNTSGTANPILGGYATPPDLRGRYALGLNDFGQPVYESILDIGFLGTELDRNTPYELDLSLGASRGESATADDGPYSMAELERILRSYDVDAGTLPSRIWELAGEFKQNPLDTTPNLALLNQWRTLLTTDSYDLPVPNVIVPEWMQTGVPGIAGSQYQTVMGRPPVGASFVDLLEYRIRVGLGILNPATITTAQQNQLRREMAKLLPPDLASGLRLDINRPIGNGRDDNNNGVVDEPGEWFDADRDGFFNNGEQEAAFWASTDTRLNDFTNTTTGIYRDDIDRDGDGTIDLWERGDTDSSGTISSQELVAIHNFRRQLLARHLYVLAMTLVDPLPSTATAQDRQARARRLAQWAINIVDFRDPDNIMTAFEFDTNPFDGWGTSDLVDGIPNPTAYASASQAQLVWGSERPELLISETMAWHDRRTSDVGSGIESANPGETASKITNASDPNSDTDFDQLYRPRGAAFIELHNPWPANPAVNGDTHKKDATTGNDLGVDISALAGTSPVWRIAVYPRPTSVTPLQCADWDPDAPNQTSPLLRMDRCVYLAQKIDIAEAATSLQNINNAEAPATPIIEYFTTLPVRSVRPGRYLVIGSGEEVDASGNKRLGTGVYASEIGDLDPTAGGTIRRRVELRVSDLTTPVKYIEPNNTANLRGNEISFSDPQDAARAICDVAVMTHAVVSGTSRKHRFTFSEPAKGYPGDLGVITTGPAYFDDPAGEGRYGNAAQAAAYDTPHDDNRADGETRLSLPSNITTQRIVECFSMVCLQRLANPLLPFEKDTNPYRTIDTMSVNVPVFNGHQGSYASTGVHGEKRNNGGTIKEYGNGKSTRHFASLQRGHAATILGAAGVSQANLFGNEPPSAQARQPTAYQADVPQGQFDIPFSPTGNSINIIPDFTLGAINHSFLSTADRNALLSRNSGQVNALDGLTPAQPFPWLTWNNRPYVSGNELMLVPRSRSSQLLREFSGQANGTNPFVKADVPNATVVNGPNYTSQEAQGPYGHLPNMFLSQTPGASKLPDVPAGMSRVLDYLHVPSRFVGTETWLNPANFGVQVSNITDARLNRQPPFNRISSYRDPGRVNLNTIVSADVWDGGLLHRQLFDSTQAWNPLANNYSTPNLAAGFPGHAGPLFVDTTAPNKQGLLESRRGYAGANAALDSSLLPLDPNVPTFFANPFRSSDAGNLVPLLQLRRANVDCQELRSDALPQITQAGGILNPATTGATPIKPSNLPLMAGNKTTSYDNADRNPYFRYQPMTRLSNLTTTRSNVYAVWVTIGFFEVEEAPDKSTFSANNGGITGAALDVIYDKVYPDGYQLSSEAGIETGDIERIREFALIDRTIPVAFEPGNQHNIDRAIRLRRRID